MPARRSIAPGLAYGPARKETVMTGYNPGERSGHGLQLDPLTREGGRSNAGIWGVALVLLAAIVVAVVATSGHDRSTAPVRPAPGGPPATTGQSSGQR